MRDRHTQFGQAGLDFLGNNRGGVVALKSQRRDVRLRVVTTVDLYRNQTTGVAKA